MSRKTQLLSLVLAAVAVMANQHVMSQEPEAAAAEAAAGPERKWSDDNFPAVSTTMYCIINLTSQYFLVMTALAVARTYQQMKGGNAGAGAVAVLEAASQTVTVAPMICILFLGIRLRAIQLSNGDTDGAGLPQKYVGQAMQTCSFAVLAQVLVILVIPVFTGEASVPTDDDGNVDIEKLEKQLSPAVVITLNFVRYATMLALYGGFAAAVYGVYTMQGPDGVDAPVSDAVSATVNLTIQFFAIYLLLAIVRTAIGFKGFNNELMKLDGSLQIAKSTVNMAPMLCILFIAARMRALQIDPVNGQPPEYARNCFHLCAYSCLVQCLLVIFLPYLVGLVSDAKVTCEQGLFEGDIVFSGLTGWIATIMTIVRYAAVAALYGGFSVVVYACFNMPADTPTPLSPALLCVLNLTAQYFTIYLLLFIFGTVRQFTQSGGHACEVMNSAVQTVMYAPMLSVLFLALRMRALQLARAKDGSIPADAAPAYKSQQCMYFATWSVLVQVLLVVIIGAMYPGAVDMDKDGNVKTPKGVSNIVGGILNFVRYACMLSMYGGACYILYDAVYMKPSDLPPWNKTQEGVLAPIPILEDVVKANKPAVLPVKDDGKDMGDAVAQVVPPVVEKAVAFFL